MGEVAAEVNERLELDRRAPGAAEHPREQLARGLDAALSPPPLLDEERSRCGGQLGGHTDVVPQHEAPTRHLCAVADVQILGEGVRLPAPGVDEGLAAPQSRGPVEVEEAAAAVAPPLLQEEVSVKQECLRPGQPGVVLVEVVPAGLHHPHAGVGHGGQQGLEEVGSGHEVCVQDEDVLAARRFEARREGARLVAGADLAVVHGDVDAPAPPRARSPPREQGRFVGGVVEDLDLEVRPRVGKPAGRIDEAFDDVLLVEDGELHGDVGRGGVRRIRGLAGRGAAGSSACRWKGYTGRWPTDRATGTPPCQPEQRQAMRREWHQQGEHNPVHRDGAEGEQFGHRHTSKRPPLPWTTNLRPRGTAGCSRLPGTAGREFGDAVTTIRPARGAPPAGGFR